MLTVLYDNSPSSGCGSLELPRQSRVMGRTGPGVPCGLLLVPLENNTVFSSDALQAEISHSLHVPRVPRGAGAEG